jgi:hypothetical protein
MNITQEHIRAAGGIVHADGNIFFTNLDKVKTAIALAASAQSYMVSDQENEQFSHAVCSFNGSNPEATKHALEQFLKNRQIPAAPAQDLIRIAAPGLGAWSAFDSVDEQRIADPFKPYTQPAPATAYVIDVDPREIRKLIAGGIIGPKESQDSSPPPQSDQSPSEFDLQKCWITKEDGTIDGIASMRLVLEKFGTASAAQSVPEHLDVRSILLDITPGDGGGHEVYAKSVDEVVDTLTRFAVRIEELERAQAAAPANAPLFWYRPASNGSYDGPIHDAHMELVRKGSGAWVPLVPAAATLTATDQEQTEKVLIDGTAYTVPAAVAIELLRLHIQIQSGVLAIPSGWSLTLDGQHIKLMSPHTTWWHFGPNANGPDRIMWELLHAMLIAAPAQRERLAGLQDVANEYDHLIRHMDAGGEYCTFQKERGASQVKTGSLTEPRELDKSARAAIAWVLFHHQGSSSPIGQPLRYALGLGAHDRLPDQLIKEAKKWADETNVKTADFNRTERGTPTITFEMAQRFLEVALRNVELVGERGPSSEEIKQGIAAMLADAPVLPAHKVDEA